MSTARERDRFRKHESGAEKRKKFKKKEEFHKLLRGSLDKFISTASDAVAATSISITHTDTVAEPSGLLQQQDGNARTEDDGEVQGEEGG